MSEPFLAEIRMFSFDFPPRGWAECNGQLLAINQNQALFSLLGTTYGGNGTVNFALPDLRSRVPIHFGNSNPLGTRAGVENHTLATTEIPPHNHLLNASSASGDTPVPPGSALAQFANAYASATVDASSLVMLRNESAGLSGGGQGHSNVQPSLVVKFGIALQGIFPSRN
jgi:microcystin-dependent protein